MNNLISAILIVAVLALAWMNYQTTQQLQQSERHIALLQESLSSTQQQLAQVQNQVTELDKASVQGLVKEANGAILDGWEALVNSVENEVRKAREALQQNNDAPNPETGPELESPDGTDRT